MIYSFIWKGNDKVKRAALINDIENGGLRMLDIQSMIHSQRVMVLKKYADKEHISSWRTILDFFLFRVGRDFILKCNFDTRKLPVYLPAFYKECLDVWTLLNESSVSSYSDVVHQVIWNNKFTNVQKVSLYKEYMLLKGIVTVGDLLSDTGSFLKGLKVLNANLSPVEHFKLPVMSIVNAIPQRWEFIIRQSTQHVTSYISDMIYLKMGNFDEVALSEVSSKKLYEAFRNKKQVPPTAQTKLKEKFPHFSVDWREIYSLPFTVTIETKIREFQYKILNNIIYTNQKLFKLKMIESPLSTSCKRETESLEHLFFNCYVTKFFWEAFCFWLIECSISLQPLTLTDTVFGIFNVEKDFDILNHLVLVAKLYIYKCKLNNVNPSLQVYKTKIKGVYQTEKRIAAS